MSEAQIQKFMGEVSNELKNISKTLEEIKESNREMKTDTADIKKNAALTDAQLTAMQQKISEVEIKVKKHEKFLNQLVAWALGIAMAAGAAGSYLGKVILSLFK